MLLEPRMYFGQHKGMSYRGRQKPGCGPLWVLLRLFLVWGPSMLCAKHRGKLDQWVSKGPQEPWTLQKCLRDPDSICTRTALFLFS